MMKKFKTVENLLESILDIKEESSMEKELAKTMQIPLNCDDCSNLERNVEENQEPAFLKQEQFEFEQSLLFIQDQLQDNIREEEDNIFDVLEKFSNE